MPLAIVFNGSDIIPTILYQDTDSELLKALKALKESPSLKTIEEAKGWLYTLDEPSGYFATIKDAKSYTERLKSEKRATPEEVKEARQQLGLSRAEFAEKIGVGGNGNTRHKFIHSVENQIPNSKSGQPPQLSVVSTKRMRALLAEKGMEALK